MSAPLNGRCDQCGGNIEFDAPDTGAIAACPLCGKDTFLQPAEPAGTSDADEPPSSTTAPRKSRRARVLAVVVIALIAIGGTAAAFFAKRAKHSAGTEDPPAGKPVRSNPAGSASKPDDDPPKDVTPVVANFQAGLSAKSIQRGREVFLSSCTECHRLYDPAFYSATAWANTLGSMRGKAKLNGAQYDDLQTFVKTLRSP